MFSEAYPPLPENHPSFSALGLEPSTLRFSAYISLYMYIDLGIGNNLLLCSVEINLKQFIGVSFGNCMYVDPQVGNAAKAREVRSDLNLAQKTPLTLYKLHFLLQFLGYSSRIVS